MTRILVVDDTPDMAELLRYACEEKGHCVQVARNGPEALALVADKAPDVILLDIMMPRMSGIDVLHELKQHAAWRAIPVILVTAKSDDKDVITGLNGGAHDYVTKPFRREILLARVASAVRIKEDHDRLEELNEKLKGEIVERERVQGELMHARKLEAVGQLAAGIAHEINTPTQYVGDNTRFLEEAFADLERLFSRFHKLLDAAKRHDVTDELLATVEDFIEQVDADYLFDEVPKAIRQSLDGIKQIAGVVRSMKEFSHPGGLEKRNVDLNRAIQNTLTISRSEWKYVADVVADLAPDLPPVDGFPGDLNQLVLNLIVNAAHAIRSKIESNGSAGKGTITVRTRRNAEFAEIELTDTGCGIPEEIRDRVFDPFFTTKEVGAGTGQGLAIAQTVVVKKHGGTISFQTEVGRGTTFIVRLPISDSVKSEDAGECRVAAF